LSVEHKLVISVTVKSNQIKSNLFATKKEHNATQKNKANISTGHKGSMKLH